MGLRDIKQTLRTENRALKYSTKEPRNLACETVFVYADDESELVYIKLKQPHLDADSGASLTRPAPVSGRRLENMLSDYECEMVPMSSVTRVVSSVSDRESPGPNLDELAGKYV